MRIAKVFALVLLCCPVLVAAQTKEFPDTSGNAFLRLCSAIDKEKLTDEEIAHVTSCVGYVAGFVDGVSVYPIYAEAKAKQKVPKLICRPDGVEHGQLISVVLKYIRNHPEDAHLPTQLLIMGAIGEAFPCSNK
ncbi:MAG: Rap1a/Tai family immunity protein [Terriglobales bacterium]